MSKEGHQVRLVTGACPGRRAHGLETGVLLFITDVPRSHSGQRCPACRSLSKGLPTLSSLFSRVSAACSPCHCLP